MSLSRCRAFLIGLTCLIVAVGALIWIWYPQEVHFSQADCDRIQPGMTETEVDAILGTPAGDYATGTHILFDPVRVRWGSIYLDDDRPVPTVKTERSWISNTGAVLVGFDDTGLVVSKKFMGVGHVLTRLRLRPTRCKQEGSGRAEVGYAGSTPV